MIKKNSPGRFPETRLHFLALVSGMYILNSLLFDGVCEGSVIISREYFKRSICQGHCVC